MSPIVAVNAVTVRFGGLVALDTVGFRVAGGEIVGLIGPNGAGKTTLFSTLMGLVRPSAGSICLEDHRVDGMKPHLIARRAMTKTFQNTALFPQMSLVENVMTAAVVHGSVQEARAEALRCLELVGLRRVAEQPVRSLTFPQKALAEVARALATRPKVLLLDEVMAALTHVEMDEVMASLRRLRDEQGITLIIVEHHMRAIMGLSDRVLVLNFGRLIAEGSPAEVSRNPDVLTAYLGHSHDAHH
ncbi:ABC transporter ATP-binding protein [Paroceanicella profunda]|uniref:ABC transporter ATP-binding protein n=1 Tax=Paroceanicella profunda TaxID=2579971 RepID=A0A5B8G219_9RHOB|nr:ABC transporter ATP-binding protein [Paroceanicella profunda]QDL93319.1 ABC transporter ATP-binding protein [Paroceanicella profunda]